MTDFAQQSFLCPGCGADIDAPDQVFELNCFVLVRAAKARPAEVLLATLIL